MNAQEMTAVLDALAAKLAVPVAHLWAVLVRQARIGLVFDALWTLIASYVLYLIVRKWWPSINPQDRWDAVDTGFVRAGAIAAAGIVLVVLTFSVYGAVTALVNPEYAALRLIFEAVGK